MRFQFYAIVPGEQNRPSLCPLGEAFERPVNSIMGTLREDAMAFAETMFAKVLGERPLGFGQIVLISPSLGEPPGSIIAAEVVDAVRRRSQLEWTWSDGSIHI